LKDRELIDGSAGQDGGQGSSGFRVASELEGDIHVLSVSGDLDVASVSELELAVSRAVSDGSSKLVVDLGECEFIDSSGVRALIIGDRALREDGNPDATMAVAAPHDQVLRILALVGLDERVPVAPSRAEAIERLR
jgi:anti-sigma B factor antagonist